MFGVAPFRLNLSWAMVKVSDKPCDTSHDCLLPSAGFDAFAQRWGARNQSKYEGISNATSPEDVKSVGGIYPYSTYFYDAVWAMAKAIDALKQEGSHGEGGYVRIHIFRM